MKPETVFRKNRVIPFLKTLKNTAFFPIQQLAISGDPDFMLCVAGRFVALEIKKSDAKADMPRGLQIFKLTEVSRAFGVSLVATPENWEVIKQQLSDMDKESVWKKLANLQLK